MKHWSKEDAKAYIESNIEVNETTGCHEWQGPKSRDGYGQIGPSGIVKTYGIKGAHRLAVHLYQDFEFTDRSQQVMHLCHNRSCCNPGPGHLKVGTAAENMNERETMRNMSLARSGVSWEHKMTEECVRATFALYKAGIKKADIARLFRCSWSTVHNILIRKSWRWVIL